MVVTVPAIVEGLRYPDAQELAITAVRWEDLAPPDMAVEPEIYLPYRASLTEDLKQKVIDYFENTLFEENWEQTGRYPSVSESWTMRHYVKGDEILAIGHARKSFLNGNKSIAEHWPGAGSDADHHGYGQPL